MREAPQINSMLNSLISRANKMNVDADSKILTLTYLDPETNNTTEAKIIFNDGALTYQNTGGSSWDITTQLDRENGIEYTVANGILIIKLIGLDPDPDDDKINGGEIYYSTTPL